MFEFKSNMRMSQNSRFGFIWSCIQDKTYHIFAAFLLVNIFGHICIRVYLAKKKNASGYNGLFILEFFSPKILDLTPLCVRKTDGSVVKATK